MTNYINYKAEDFLRDDYFIHSMLHPTLESVAYWEKLIKEGIISGEEFYFAKHCISSVTTEKEPMSEVELNRLFQRIEADTVKRLQRRRKIFLYGAAASIALILGVTLWLLSPKDGEDAILYAGSQHPKIDSKHIELILSDNERIAIEEDNASIDYGQKGTIKINEKPLDKTPDNGKKKKETEFNRLNIPFGKRSSLTLEDGTRVWINAGSRIVYPATFDKDKREIYVDGEIYIDVAKETDRPFLVRTSDMQITVRGTSFNITAYESDETSSIVLINGSVEVKSKDHEKTYRLKPDDMLVKQNDRINIKQVKAQAFISWVNGMYVCDYERLESILLRLSRYYNVKVTIDNDAAELLCSGKLELKDDIADVLDVLVSTAPVVYEINENREYHFMFNPSLK
jgi:ferric-dicitrate binding protein FerR (iron transport regulator)